MRATQWIGIAVLLLAGCTADLGDGASGEGRGRWSAERGIFAMDISMWSRSITDTEVACLREEGVRHMIIGTQDRRLARQQLEQSMSGGMSLDAYVYLYWDRSTAAQVQRALEMVDGYPVGRLWLDLEDRPPGSLGRSGLRRMIREALDACGDTPCGIYTADWWWNEELGRTTEFGDVPLWYAEWDDDPSMSQWGVDERFGGWEQPFGKQYWGDIRVCDVLGDVNTFAEAPPPAFEPPAPIAPTGGVPATPGRLYPDGEEIPYAPSGALRILAGGVPEATGYRFEVEHWNGSSWRPYWTWERDSNGYVFSPAMGDTSYRFRVSAGNAHGWSEPSSWAGFHWGTGGARAPAEDPSPEDPTPSDPTPSDPTPEEPPPSDPTPEDPTPSEPTPSEPSPEGAPTGLTPDVGYETGPAVTLGWDPVSGATRYQVTIEHSTGSAFSHYYTYHSTTTAKTFYPAVHSAVYRWRVRAEVGGSWGPWSSDATFGFE